MGKPFGREQCWLLSRLTIKGGVLGRNLTIVEEDDDSENPNVDVNFASSAFTRLMIVGEADFIISHMLGLVYREIASDHRKILFSISDVADELTQGVLDDYVRYKYYFRVLVQEIKPRLLEA
jgi:hypothetical protein